MSRVKRGVAAHKKHKKLLSQAEGRRASKHKLVRYPKAGCWVSYSRTAGDTPIVTVTIQKMP